ncbi:hypothetical protein RDWZM_007100 [Blomia tropicalis]|uniref:Uncharacterized protein n=1 Tax=Blomia tropicalis TaxID=40697 RepID=A0A9Q0RMD7_BLOTA|nr:hypothetical protein RDWZM_007100 [Blomia tropicalis]
MGSTCSTVKKSGSKDGKSNERKESAESIPYGQASSENTGAHGSSGTKDTVRVTNNITSVSNTASTSHPSQVEANVTTTNTTTTNITTITTTTTISSSNDQTGPTPQSLSPIPPASSPSPYSGSGNNGPNAASSYQNISPTKGHLSLSQYSKTERAMSYTQLFHVRSGLNETIRSDDSLDVEDFYVLAVSTESDELVVWNVYEQRAVRTLRNIPRPRELQMVDHMHAVALCDRELMLIDLDRVELLTKLQGVMNQKMPFFGLHSDRSVVALSRSRMYVNFINLESGHVETTFKAGEDRFLNSLLTSANGKICVCGDETQKPFPLLVWDLSNRKLLYDLRIPKHEFITRLSAISNDGHFVVSVCQECGSNSPNHLVVYDLQSGTQFKKWKPEHNSVSVAISTRCAGVVINGMENNDLLVWDMCTGALKHTLSGHTAPPDLLQMTEKANLFLSYNSKRSDPQLRIWSYENGTCLWTFTPEQELSCCCLTSNGRALVYGFVGEKRLHLAIRSDSMKSDIENEKAAQTYIDEMCKKIIPYGDEEMNGRNVDLKLS